MIISRVYIFQLINFWQHLGDLDPMSGITDKHQGKNILPFDEAITIRYLYFPFFKICENKELCFSRF